jgi:hypothetical protein
METVNDVAEQFRDGRFLPHLYPEGRTDYPIYQALFDKCSSKISFQFVNVKDLDFVDAQIRRHPEIPINCKEVVQKCKENKLDMGIIDRDMLTENALREELPNLAMTDTRDLETLMVYLDSSYLLDRLGLKCPGLPSVLPSAFYLGALIGAFSNTENKPAVQCLFKQYGRPKFFQTVLRLGELPSFFAKIDDYFPKEGASALPKGKDFFDFLFSQAFQSASGIFEVDLLSAQNQIKDSAGRKPEIAASDLSTDDGTVWILEKENAPLLVEDNHPFSITIEQVEKVLKEDFENRQKDVAFFRLPRGHDLMAILAEIFYRRQASISDKETSTKYSEAVDDKKRKSINSQFAKDFSCLFWNQLKQTDPWDEKPFENFKKTEMFKKVMSWATDLYEQHYLHDTDTYTNSEPA